MNNIIQVEKFCEDRNLQFTKIRKDVYELIFKSSIPLKAYDLLETLKNTHRSAKPITIYRALDFLLENKLIHKLPSQSTYFRCDHPADNHDCYFIICNQCHEIEICIYYYWIRK